MKMALIGASGQLGTDLRKVLESRGHLVVPIRHAELEITDAAQIDKMMSEVQPEVVINTAAFHKVEECERQPQLAFDVNAVAPLRLAQACARTGAWLVHFSTDYVFDGAQRTPYTETDRPAPLNVYGASKAAGEYLISANTDRFIIIRTSGLYGTAGSSGKGGNFVETMLKKAHAGEPIRVVNDQVLTPTFTEDLAQVTAQMIELRAAGLYHVSSEGACSWYEFARKIFKIEGLQVDLRPVPTSEFPSPVRRPAYSVLSKQRLRSLGLEMPVWEDALARYLKVARPAAAGRGEVNRAQARQ